MKRKADRTEEEEIAFREANRARVQEGAQKNYMQTGSKQTHSSIRNTKKKERKGSFSREKYKYSSIAKRWYAK